MKPSLQACTKHESPGKSSRLTQNGTWVPREILGAGSFRPFSIHAFRSESAIICRMSCHWEARRWEEIAIPVNKPCQCWHSESESDVRSPPMDFGLRLKGISLKCGQFVSGTCSGIHDNSPIFCLSFIRRTWRIRHLGVFRRSYMIPFRAWHCLIHQQLCYFITDRCL